MDIHTLLESYKQLSKEEKIQFKIEVEKESKDGIQRKIENIKNQIDDNVEEKNKKIRKCVEWCCFFPKTCIQVCHLSLKLFISFMMFIAFILMIGFFKNMIF